jgi:Ca2+-binding RTX toxin-like protein
MRRTLLLATILLATLPAAAQASVVSVVSGGTLTVTGDGAADPITVRLASPTTVEVNGAAFARSTFTKIAIRSGGGDDTIRIVDALTETVTIESGPGADAVTGGPGSETIAGGDQADLVHPGGGDDTVSAGAGDDTLIQGDGFDQIDGEGGADTLQATGSDVQDEITLQSSGALLRVARDTGPATTESRGIEALEVRAEGGPDLIDVGDLDPTEITRLDADLGASDGARDQIAVNGTDRFDFLEIEPAGDAVEVAHRVSAAPPVRIRNSRPGEDRLTVFGHGDIDFLEADPGIGERIALTIDGGAGDDSISASNGADELRGGPDDDTITGRRGDDVIDLGDGNDTVHRSAPDGRDRVEGGAGEDMMTAAGSAADDAIDVGRLLSRTRVHYGFEGQTDASNVERVDIGAQGGTDKVTVLDLTGTATRTVNVFSADSDQRVDTLVVGGSQGNDSILATTTGTTETVSGLAATVNYVRPERGEKLLIDGGNGDDTIDARTIVRDRIQPELRGSAGKDVLLGTPGDDLAGGGIGDDLVFLGGGLDTATWGPGEGNDIIEGGGGDNFLRMDGSGAGERIDVTALGGRTQVTRDVENVRLDMSDVTRLDILPGTGADTVHVGDLSGTDVKNVEVDLARARGTIDRDQAPDAVLVDGTSGIDAITATGAGPQVRLTGLPAVTTTVFSEPALDRLHVDTRAGTDTVNVAGSTHQLIAFSFTQ